MPSPAKAALLALGLLLVSASPAGAMDIDPAAALDTTQVVDARTAPERSLTVQRSFPAPVAAPHQGPRLPRPLAIGLGSWGLILVSVAIYPTKESR